MGTSWSQIGVHWSRFHGSLVDTLIVVHLMNLTGTETVLSRLAVFRNPCEMPVTTVTVGIEIGAGMTRHDYQISTAGHLEASPCNLHDQHHLKQIAAPCSVLTVQQSSALTKSQ